MPPWLLEEKKPDPNEIEKLNNTDPATLRTRVIDLEGKVHELKQLVTYREDVILRIYQVNACFNYVFIGLCRSA